MMKGKEGITLTRDLVKDVGVGAVIPDGSQAWPQWIFDLHSLYRQRRPFSADPAAMMRVVLRFVARGDMEGAKMAVNVYAQSVDWCVPSDDDHME